MDMFTMFRCRAKMSGVLIHPQWHNLLFIDELYYRELCVEFYSTFIHEVPTSKRNQPYVEFMLGRHHNVMNYDSFDQATGLDNTVMTMLKREYARDFIYQKAYRAICL
ncbi:unnamed protein product [Linum trigynum]|uniref:Uncharacterized protein n=1 Tax=Linum trigynum TaxID=586398 RepID=A0AAV2G8D8_9ROSI